MPLTGTIVVMTTTSGPQRPAARAVRADAAAAPPARPRLALLVRGYSVLAYSAFLAAAWWAIGFIARGFGAVPTSIDGRGGTAGRAGLPAWAALAADAGLLAVFAVQHSVMARAGFKRALARMLPGAAERSTYVLASSLALALTFWLWQPAPAVIWRVQDGPWAAAVWAVYALGWVVAVSATFMIDHLDFLGLRQAGWRPGQADRGAAEPELAERYLYRWIRHPMMLGLLIAFVATPVMTVGHAFFALASAGYIAFGVRLEERDLTAQLGAAYREYARRVPPVLPVPRRARRLR